MDKLNKNLIDKQERFANLSSRILKASAIITEYARTEHEAIIVPANSTPEQIQEILKANGYDPEQFLRGVKIYG